MQTNKKTVTEFFDRLAPNWDNTHVPDPAVIGHILELADIRPGLTVLDVACGTGVLFPHYLDRKVKEITGVDLSPAMVALAQKKFPQPNIHLIRADIQACRFDPPFDRCMVYNALPHFSDPGQLLRQLANCVKPGGRLTIAHGCSKELLDRYHAAHAAEVSHPLPEAEALSRMLDHWFVVDICLDDAEKYVVSGLRNDTVTGSMVPSTDKR